MVVCWDVSNMLTNLSDSEISPSNLFRNLGSTKKLTINGLKSVNENNLQQIYISKSSYWRNNFYNHANNRFLERIQLFSKVKGNEM